MATRLKQTLDEHWLVALSAYEKEHDGPFSIEAFVAWAVENGWAELPRVDPKRLLARQARRALRNSRTHDEQGRRVRSLLPATYDVVGEDGEVRNVVLWDRLDRMSYDHAARSFGQRDENIRTQRIAATRDLASALENNPNLHGRDEQLVFDFLLPESPEPEYIEATPRRPK